MQGDILRYTSKLVNEQMKTKLGLNRTGVIYC